MKSEVFKLSSELGINKEILNAKPTDGLWDDDRSDEDQIGASYPELCSGIYLRHIVLWNSKDKALINLKVYVNLHFQTSL